MTLRNSSACAMTVRSPMDSSIFESYLTPLCCVNSHVVDVYGRRSAAEKAYTREEWGLIQRMKQAKDRMLPESEMAWQKTLREVARAVQVPVKFLMGRETWEDMQGQYKIPVDASVVISGGPVRASYNGEHVTLGSEKYGSLGSWQVETPTPRAPTHRTRMT